MVKNLPEMQETQVWSLAWENPLEKRMALATSDKFWALEPNLEDELCWGRGFCLQCQHWQEAMILPTWVARISQWFPSYYPELPWQFWPGLPVPTSRPWFPSHGPWDAVPITFGLEGWGEDSVNGHWKVMKRDLRIWRLYRESNLRFWRWLDISETSFSHW